METSYLSVEANSHQRLVSRHIVIWIRGKQRKKNKTKTKQKQKKERKQKKTKEDNRS